MEDYLPLLSSVAPSIVLLYVFYSQDKFPEPFIMIFKTFFLGVLISVPALILNEYSMDQIMKSYENENIGYNLAVFYESLIPGAFVEESLKFLVLFFFCFRSKHLDEKMDALVYGTTVSLGFATIENYEYVMYASEYGITWHEMAWIRAFSAVPAHAMWGIIMGHFLYNYKENPFKSIVLALGVPLVLHTLYNATYFSYVLVLFISLYLTISFISRSKKIQQLSPWG